METETVSKKDIALPLKYYEGKEPTPEELVLYAEVFKSIGIIGQKFLVHKQPFIGNVLLSLDIVLDTTIDTAATDFRNVYVNPGFWAKLDDLERTFVLAHEIWHVAMNHALRRQERIPELWNIACDLEIHFILRNENFKEPWCLRHDPSWAPYSAERIYDELLKAKQQNRQSGQASQQSGQDNQSGQSGFPNGNGISNRKFGPNTRSFDGVIYDGDKSEDGDKGGNSKTKGKGNVVRFGEWKAASEESEDVGEFVRRIVAQAVIITRKRNGIVPGSVAGIIDEIDNPVVPWQRQLDNWTTRAMGEWGHNTYKRLNPRSWSYGVILPTTENESLKVAVALDTSGSCGPELKRFFSELVGIINTYDEYELTVIQCDSRIQDVKKYTSDEPYDPEDGFQVHGMGGTDFRPVFNYIEEDDLNPTALIYLTDGYGPAPDEEPDYPVLWVITQGGHRPCPWGDAVSLTNDRVK